MSFDNIIFSIKASDVLTTIQACRLFPRHIEYPQHIGITESGTIRSGPSARRLGIGTFLPRGLAIRFAFPLRGDPVEEIYVAKEILKSLNLMNGPVVIACPTCGRTQIDVSELAKKVEALVAPLSIPIRIAVMGCIVNGPGEARDADIGVAGGKGEGQIFIKGKPVVKVSEDKLLETLWAYIQQSIPTAMLTRIIAIPHNSAKYKLLHIATCCKIV